MDQREDGDPYRLFGDTSRLPESKLEQRDILLAAFREERRAAETRMRAALPVIVLYGCLGLALIVACVVWMLGA